jgi:hypothetical protein
MRQIEQLIPVYIDNSPHLQDDLSDKGYEELEEAFIEDASNISFQWTPDPFGRS